MLIVFFVVVVLWFCACGELDCSCVECELLIFEKEPSRKSCTLVKSVVLVFIWGIFL